MIPDRDYYADKHGKLTDNPDEFAQQIGVRGCFLDERVAKRYGISDVLVSVDEPNAPRRVTGRNSASVQIIKADEEKSVEEQPQEPAAAAELIAEEPEVEKPKPGAKKSAVKKGEKRK